ncbi:hypothetical protein JB92DRAFT_207632 [Gautieria morchelliformis]|nr:hypothetical protein JB92DRAFT_207632 [Gautieria morchelliformis]
MTTPHRSDTPPSLSPESGTPAGEWAKETEGAIEQHALSKGATEASNTTATPARELPGAFPISQPPEVSSTSTKLGQTAKQSVEGVYMTAQNGVEGVYATAEHAARQYLPTSVVDKLEGVGVLREDTGFQETPLSTNDPESNTAPSQGSVGSLPGSKEPAGVAKVPEVSKKEVTEGGASMNPRIASPPAHSTNGPYPPSTESLVSPHL